MGTASSFPYAQTEALPQPSGSVWTAHKGKRKDDGEPVTIFRCAFNNSANKTYATNLTRRLKTIRHPNVLKFIDCTETPDSLYLVTEAVEPLAQFWDPRSGLTATLSDLECSLGLFQISGALKFMHSAGLVHGAIGVNSIWVTGAGEWKLSGLETCREFVELRSDSLPMLPQRYIPPDLAKGGAVNSAECSSVDSWSMGCFLYEIFNGEFNDPRQLTSVGKIPQEVFNEYKRLLATNPRNRLPMESLQNSEFFQNDLVITVDFLDNLALKGNAEKDEFFKNLADRVENFPMRIGKYKILPQLMNALQFGSGTGAKVLSAALVIAKRLSPEEFTAIVTPVIVKLFSLNERAMRVNLLKNLSLYINFLDDNIVNKEVFPHVKTGFTDSVSVLREWTVKSLVYFIPKLKENVLITQVLPFVPRLQRDPEAAIRTNTTVVVGKTAKYFSPAIREKLLIPTFTRALRDPFVPARKSSMAAFKATAEFYTPKDLANKIIPFIALHTLDPSREVRELTFSCMSIFLETLKKNSDEMQEEAQDQSSIQFASPVGEQSSGTVADSKDSGQFDIVGSIGNWAVQAATQKIVEQVVGANVASAHSSVEPARTKSSYDSSPAYQPPRKPSSDFSQPSRKISNEAKTVPSASTIRPNSVQTDNFFDEFMGGNDGDSEVIAALSFGAKSAPEKRKSSKPTPSFATEIKDDDADLGSGWSQMDEGQSGSSTPSLGPRDDLTFDLQIGPLGNSRAASPVNNSASTGVSEDDLFKSLTNSSTNNILQSSSAQGAAAGATRGGNKIPGVGRAGPRVITKSGGVNSSAKASAAALKPSTVSSVTSKPPSSGDGWEDFLGN
eukprot:TRINITY_DN44140_c0_g1_i1.p1 TRINITY_DN44140_c0_g1~~TRINITY_DN44140_c0_g1_i1.p1  ORF type:complete len:841 (-),score=195.53 TRINITY_DN44140_c0_g1_i1:980-3502(-)